MPLVIERRAMSQAGNGGTHGAPHDFLESITLWQPIQTR